MHGCHTSGSFYKHIYTYVYLSMTRTLELTRGFDSCKGKESKVWQFNVEWDAILIRLDIMECVA